MRITKKTGLNLVLAVGLGLVTVGIGNTVYAGGNPSVDYGHPRATSYICNRNVTITKEGVLSDGRPYKTFDYEVKGDDYANARFGETGSIITSYINEKGSCSPENIYTDGFWSKTGDIDPSNTFYQVNGRSPEDIYLGAPFGGPARDTNFGDRLANFYGIANSTNGNNFGEVNDAAAVDINNQRYWCVGMPSVFGSCLLQNSQDITKYGCDCWGFLNDPLWRFPPDNGVELVNNSVSSIVNKPISAIGRLGITSNAGKVQKFKLDMAAMNTQDNGSWVPGARPFVVLKGSTRITFVYPVNPPKPFDLVPYASVDVDKENPSIASFGGGVRGNQPTVNGVTISRLYEVRRTNSTKTTISPSTAALINQVVNSSGINLSIVSRNVESLNLKAGDKICAITTVTPGTGKVNAAGVIVESGASKSGEDCETIVNKPYVSFFGGDVLTCKDIDTYYNATKKVGSGAEYMVQAQSSVSQFISASLRGGNTSPKFLTLANTGGSVYGGSFNDSSCNVPRDYFTVGKPDDATANLTGTIVAPQANTPQSILYKPAPGFNSVKLNGFKIPNGSRTAIYVDGDLEINGNITYEQASDVPWASVDAIPALHVYVRGNIYINSKVDKLTGFFVAQAKNSNGGIIYTCANGRSPVTTAILNTCGTQLTVRGAFSSRRTVFLRSTNSLRNGTQAENFANSKAAERFIMGPEMYFTGPDTTSSGGGGGPTYQFITTLPPIL